MAIQLQKSIFIHIPKTGGRWVKDQLVNNIKGYSFIGDPIYEAHNSPDTLLPAFAFVRHPLTFAHSLWHHRSKKKSNKFGHQWNWQTYLRLEAVCGCGDYKRFFELIAENPGVVTDYYEHYIGKYKDIQVGKQENLAADLVRILRVNHETFNYRSIVDASTKMVGVNHNKSNIDIPVDVAKQILENESGLCDKFGYGIDLNRDYRQRASNDLF